MRITVIIPVYNSEKTIKATIDSVLRQHFTDFELIVINDGSTDSTLNVISQFNDSRLKVFSYAHAGGNVSRNRGLEMSVGEFISFLDADDIWTPDKLATQLQYLQENPDAKVAYSWTDYIDEHGEFLFSGTHITVNGNVYEKLLIANFLENGSNPLIYRDALIKLGGFDENLCAAQDWDMWLRLAQNFQFVAVPKVQIFYRVSANSLSSNLARQEKACLKVLNKAYSTSSDSFQHLRSISLTNIYKYLTWKSLQAPLNRQKGLTAARFLWKFLVNDSLRFKRMNLTLIFFIKIAILIILPPSLAAQLLNKNKSKK